MIYAKQRVVTITFNRYYPEHNGAAKIFHDDISCAVKNTLTRIYVINLRDIKEKITNVRKQGRTVVIPITVNGIFSKSIFRLFYFFAAAMKLALRIHGHRLHILTITWSGLIIGFLLSGMFKSYSIESTLYGDVDTPRRIPKPLYFIKQKLKKFLLFRADKIKVYSQLQKLELNKLEVQCVSVIPPILHSQLYYSVDLKEKELLRKKLSLNPIRHLFLFIGTLSYRKGYDILVEAIKLFNEDPEYANKADFIIVGPVVAGSKLLSFENVKYLGYIDNVPEYMQACDSLVLPTRSEGFGRVYIEALACGLSPLTTRLSGVNDYLAELAYFIDLNPKAYEQALYDQVREKAEYGANTNLEQRKRILYMFSKEVVVDKLKVFFEVQ